MDPPREAAAAGAPRLPRGRGDGPSRSVASAAGAVAPPRSRGWTLVALGHQIGGVGSPAVAGMDPAMTLLQAGVAWLPRGRGDGPVLVYSRFTVLLAPPRSRGWTRRRGSPAVAGMDPNRHARKYMLTGLPRGRGDGPRVGAGDGSSGVAPPRSRGWTRSRNASCTSSFASSALIAASTPPPSAHYVRSLPAAPTRFGPPCSEGCTRRDRAALRSGYGGRSPGERGELLSSF